LSRYEEFVALLRDNLAYGGWAIAFEPMQGYDLQATKMWNRSLITFLLRKMQGDASTIRKLTEAEYGRILSIRRRSPFGATISVLAHIHSGPEGPEWLPTGIKCSAFLRGSYVVNWLLDLCRKRVLRNRGLPRMRIGIREIEASLQGRSCGPAAR